VPFQRLGKHMRQQTPATMTGFERYTKKARSAIFLKEIGQFVSWRELCAVIEAVYPKAGNGRRPSGWSACCAFTYRSFSFSRVPEWAWYMNEILSSHLGSLDAQRWARTFRLACRRTKALENFSPGRSCELHQTALDPDGRRSQRKHTPPIYREGLPAPAAA
jgi:hypothetical protein